MPTGPEDMPVTRILGISGQKTRKETETKEQNPHPIKTNTRIKSQTYDHPNSRFINASVRIHSVPEMMGEPSDATPAIYKHTMQLTHKKMTLK